MPEKNTNVTQGTDFYNMLVPYNSTTKMVPFGGSTNSQSDGINTIKRIEFVLPSSLVGNMPIESSTYKFIINPEEYDQSEPGKSTVTQTKGGYWIDDFGAGVPTINIKGTTGFNGGIDNQSGWRKWRELRNLIRAYYYGTAPGTDTKEEMEFHNYTDNEHWYVVPKTFSLKRSISRPLLYCYTISLVCIRPIGVPQSINQNLVIELPYVMEGETENATSIL